MYCGLNRLPASVNELQHLYLPVDVAVGEKRLLDDPCALRRPLMPRLDRDK